MTDEYISRRLTPHGPFKGVHQIAMTFDRYAAMGIINEILGFLDDECGEVGYEYNPGLEELEIFALMSYENVKDFEMMGYDRYLCYSCDIDQKKPNEED